MLMGTVPTHIGYELLTQNPDSCQCTVHILDTECVSEYDV